MKIRKNLKTHLFIGVLSFAVFLGCWELFSRFNAEMRFVLPSPSKVAITIWGHGDRLGMHALATFKEMLGGFLIAFCVAFPLAWLMALFTTLRAVLQPAFVAIQCVPIFALAPLMVLWFGWSYIAIIVSTALMIFFPLTISIYQGLCATPKHLLDFFQTHQATPWQIFFKLQLPWALPHIFSGFRIAVAIAGIGAVAGEWAGAQEGLGLLMLESRRGADVEMMFAALTCVTALSLGLYAFAILLQNIVESRPKAKISIVRSTALALLATLCFTGCQNVEKGPRNTTLILDWLPNPNHVAIYAGIKKGFFEEQGIHLKITKVVDPSDGIPYLISNQADIALTYMPHTIQALSHGAKVVPIGILVEVPLNAVIYRSDEGIEKPEDLSGKVIGYCVDGYHTAFLKSMLSNRKVVAGELRNVSFDLVTMLGTDKVDALYGAYWNIEVENLRHWGVDTSYFPLSDFGVPRYYELIFVVRSQSNQLKPQFVEAFKAALQKSIDFAVAKPEEAFEMYIRANPDKSIKTRQWEKQAWRKTVPTLAKNQDLDQGVWDTFVDWMVKTHLLPKN